jgi:hypothetical protein
MAPNLLIPPVFTDSDGTIERVTLGSAGRREAWDAKSRPWVPSRAITESVLHSRLFSAVDLSAAGISAE